MGRSGLPEGKFLLKRLPEGVGLIR